MNILRWIEDCCIQAISDNSKMGMEAAGTNKLTVVGWNILLRANRDRFPIPQDFTQWKTSPSSQWKTSPSWIAAILPGWDHLALARFLYWKSSRSDCWVCKTYYWNDVNNNKNVADQPSSEWQEQEEDNNSKNVREGTIRDWLLQGYHESFEFLYQLHGAGSGDADSLMFRERNHSL